MTQDWERALDPSDEWQEVMNLTDLAAERPSRARFTELGQAVVKWQQARRSSARESALNSVEETPIYNDIVAETVAKDHLGRTVVPDADGGYTVEATPDEQTLVDGDDQR